MVSPSDAPRVVSRTGANTNAHAITVPSFSRDVSPSVSSESSTASHVGTLNVRTRAGGWSGASASTASTSTADVSALTTASARRLPVAASRAAANRQKWNAPEVTDHAGSGLGPSVPETRQHFNVPSLPWVRTRVAEVSPRSDVSAGPGDATPGIASTDNTPELGGCAARRHSGRRSARSHATTSPLLSPDRRHSTPPSVANAMHCTSPPYPRSTIGSGAGLPPIAAPPGGANRQCVPTRSEDST